jgi:hypothetical protein
MKVYKVYESYNISWNFLGKIIHFLSFAYFIDFRFRYVISKYDRISVLLGQFQNVELLYLFTMKVKKFNIADTYLRGWESQN